MSWQHSLNDQCFHCTSDETLLRGITHHNHGEAWDGPTVHTQIPESACPYASIEDVIR